MKNPADIASQDVCNAPNPILDRIRRFAAWQKNHRAWINFADMADAWCKYKGSRLRDESKRIEAYGELHDSIVHGTFEQGNRSMLLRLGPEPSSNGRWTRGDVSVAVRGGGGDIGHYIIRDLLKTFWVPAALAREWFERQMMPMPDYLLPQAVRSRASEQPEHDAIARAAMRGAGELIEAATPKSALATSGGLKSTPTIAEPETDNRPSPSDSAVRQWFRERVAGWPDSNTAPSEEQDFQAITDHFAPGLTRYEIRLVRKKETPKAWRKQGRRPPWGIARQKLSPP